MDNPQKALAFLTAQQVEHPELAEQLAQLSDLYERKLWHQLTQKLEEYISQPAFQAGDFLIQLYQSFILDFEQKINLLKLAQIAVVVSQQYAETAVSNDFLRQVIGRLQEAKPARVEEPVVLLKMQIALVNLRMGNQPECKVLMDEGQVELDSITDVDPVVHSSLHFVSSQYWKAKQNFADFFKSSLLYLAYISADTLSGDTRLALAVDLSLAALLGENIYNFGELLGHPILKSLEGTGFAWLHEFLQAFNNGDLHQYDQLCVQHAAALNAQPAMVEHERKLREKITILCLMELIFRLPSEARTISLATIAEKTKLSIDGVEFLLMKTLSVHLIEGTIDQVEGTVHVSWVQPRVLTVPQIAGLTGRLDSWLDKVGTTLKFMEDQIPELTMH